MVLFLVVLGNLSSAPLETSPSTTDSTSQVGETPEQQIARVKSWLYSITPDQLLTSLVFYDNITRLPPTVTFPETVMVLTKEGTLVLSWKDPLKISLGGGEIKTQFVLSQIEKPKFVTWPSDDPFKWVLPAAGAGGIALIVGVVTGYLLHR